MDRLWTVIKKITGSCRSLWMSKWEKLPFCVSHFPPRIVPETNTTWDLIAQGIYQSFSLVEAWTQTFHIDNSHNDEHSKEALFWLLQIVKKTFLVFPGRSSGAISHSSLLLLLLSIHGIILHDVLDKKYMSDVDIVEYRQLLLSHLTTLFSEPHAQGLVNVMESISYSKTVLVNPLTHKEDVHFPEWISSSSDDTVSWYDVYHWVRESDLLASYNIARMLEFRSRDSLDSIEWNEWLSVVKDTQALYKKRIATLVEKKLFEHKESQEMAEHLFFVSDLKMKTLPCVDNVDNISLSKEMIHRLQHFQSRSSWDYFRIVNHIHKEELVAEWVTLLQEVGMSIHGKIHHCSSDSFLEF